MRSRGFTLIELMLASVLCAILMGGVLAVLGGTARDRKRLGAVEAMTDSRAVADLIGRDLTAADMFSSSVDGRTLVMVGHGAIDHRTLTATHRFVRVTYRVVGREPNVHLIRRQESLDDAAHREDWQGLVAAGVSSIGVTRLGTVPTRAILTLGHGAQAERREMFLK